MVSHNKTNTPLTSSLPSSCSSSSAKQRSGRRGNFSPGWVLESLGDSCEGDGHSKSRKENLRRYFEQIVGDSRRSIVKRQVIFLCLLFLTCSIFMFLNECKLTRLGGASLNYKQVSSHPSGLRFLSVSRTRRSDGRSHILDMSKNAIEVNMIKQFMQIPVQDMDRTVQPIPLGEVVATSGFSNAPLIKQSRRRLWGSSEMDEQLIGSHLDQNAFPRGIQQTGKISKIEIGVFVKDSERLLYRSEILKYKNISDVNRMDNWFSEVLICSSFVGATENVPHKFNLQSILQEDKTVLSAEDKSGDMDRCFNYDTIGTVDVSQGVSRISVPLIQDSPRSCLLWRNPKSDSVKILLASKLKSRSRSISHLESFFGRVKRIYDKMSLWKMVMTPLSSFFNLPSPLRLAADDVLLFYLFVGCSMAAVNFRSLDWNCLCSPVFIRFVVYVSINIFRFFVLYRLGNVLSEVSWLGILKYPLRFLAGGLNAPAADVLTAWHADCVRLLNYFGATATWGAVVDYSDHIVLSLMKLFILSSELGWCQVGCIQQWKFDELIKNSSLNQDCQTFGRRLSQYLVSIFHVLMIFHVVDQMLSTCLFYHSAYECIVGFCVGTIGIFVLAEKILSLCLNSSINFNLS